MPEHLGIEGNRINEDAFEDVETFCDEMVVKNTMHCMIETLPSNFEVENETGAHVTTVFKEEINDDFLYCPTRISYASFYNVKDDGLKRNPLSTYGQWATDRRKHEETRNFDIFLLQIAVIVLICLYFNDELKCATNFTDGLKKLSNKISLFGGNGS